ncbi:hypothetical protein [uncultured Draconibacterium sp.]|uniref:hypothetical protein n=1 Tax=uncultured Draconibacterium sp. TaxID=1573823 RepID=UPI0032170356
MKKNTHHIITTGSQVILLLFVLTAFNPQKTERIQRLDKSVVDSEISSIDSFVCAINDTLSNKILIVYSDRNGNPVYYSRNIDTDVCTDGECRMVSIKIFWNFTGRYLGFELPEGEFLSKSNHILFTNSEYDRLHEVLLDANSALANYTIQQLAPVKTKSSNSVDAVSSATIAAVLNYIVEGAVYTTYTLWNIVHGPTKMEIEKITEQRLSSELCLNVLNGNNLKDKIWILNHISWVKPISKDLNNKLIELLSANDKYLAERALNALQPEVITNDIQLNLAKAFKSLGFLQQRLILLKFKELDHLNVEAAEILTNELNNLNGTLSKSMLDLYTVHSIDNIETNFKIAQLLKNGNRYISEHAFQYLKHQNELDHRTQKLIHKYQKKQL